MMMCNVDVHRTLTKDQMETLKELAERPVVFDEDSRELSEEELAKFRRIPLHAGHHSPSALRCIKSVFKWILCI